MNSEDGEGMLAFEEKKKKEKKKRRGEEDLPMSIKDRYREDVDPEKMHMPSKRVKKEEGEIEVRPYKTSKWESIY